MASPVPVEVVLSSVIIKLKYTFFKAHSSIYNCLYTKFCLSPKQAVYLLIAITGHSHKLPWSLQVIWD